MLIENKFYIIFQQYKTFIGSHDGFNIINHYFFIVDRMIYLVSQICLHGLLGFWYLETNQKQFLCIFNICLRIKYNQFGLFIRFQRYIVTKKRKENSITRPNSLRTIHQERTSQIMYKLPSCHIFFSFKFNFFSSENFGIFWKNGLVVVVAASASPPA